MIEDVVHALRCPHCGAGLAPRDGTVACRAGHSFDVARQGYLSLLPGDARTATADTAEMVAARESFLAGGHFDRLGDRIAEEARTALGEEATGLVVELGAGTGWYLARVLERVPGVTGLALDLSKHALRRAARAHPRIGAVACDAWAPLPVRDGVARLALSVFAPRGPGELARVLRPDAALIVATPAPDHLGELATPLGLLGIDPSKRERLDDQLGPFFEPVRRTALRWPVRLDQDGARSAALMGPSAPHLDRDELGARIAELPAVLDVTAAVEIGLYRPRAAMRRPGSARARPDSPTRCSRR